MIDRADIVRTIAAEYSNNASVHAFWLEGADAMGTADELSDLDLWFDVQDGHEGEFLTELRKTLGRLAPLDFEYEKAHPHPLIRQAFFHLQGTSPYLIIDICVQSHSRHCEFVIGHADENPKVIFDKSNVIRYQELDAHSYRDEIHRRAMELKKTFAFFSVWVHKEAARDKFLETINYYYMYVLRPLVEMVRICYQPTKKDYYLKHIQRDLPEEVVASLEELYKVNSIGSILEKTHRAQIMFNHVYTLYQQSASADQDPGQV